ncbi:MAG: CopG family transcriptional regulator [Candidatus Dormibacteria bacterium]
MSKARFVLKASTPLTSELEEQLAAEAEAGYDLTKARRVDLRPGRPSKGQAAGESPRVAFRVPRGVYEVAKSRAAAEGRTLSTVLRELLAAYAVDDHVA